MKKYNINWKNNLFILNYFRETQIESLYRELDECKQILLNVWRYKKENSVFIYDNSIYNERNNLNDTKYMLDVISKSQLPYSYNGIIFNDKKDVYYKMSGLIKMIKQNIEYIQKNIKKDYRDIKSSVVVNKKHKKKNDFDYEINNIELEKDDNDKVATKKYFLLKKREHG